MVVEDRPVKWKRRRGRSLGQHPVDEAKRLATLTLVGTFSRESAWLCVPPEVAFLLDRLCLGCAGAQASRRPPLSLGRPPRVSRRRLRSLSPGT